jgi:predicted ATPase
MPVRGPNRAPNRGDGEILAPSRLDPEAIKAQVETVLESPGFANAPNLAAFLRHVVECSLEGQSDRLKEYCIGVEVFDRGESFDPSIDTIVRSQARRMRAKLKEYYAGCGLADPVLIEVPKGGYAARFAGREPSAYPADGPRGRRLPAPLTSFVGRQEELRAISKLLADPDVRWVTLSGPGGSGKTRLALEVARMVRPRLPGGVYFVPLASVAAPNGVELAVAQAFGVTRTDGLPLAEALQRFLDRSVSSPTLLLVDNFEHVATAGAWIARLLEEADTLKVLATSRETLRVYGEHEFPVSPLPTLGSSEAKELESCTKNPAVFLFTQRARAADPGFCLNASNAAMVAEICRLLDGLPLAIELAAARQKTLGVAGLLERLARPLEVLTHGAVSLPERQQTLRNTIEWSHSLLTDTEKTLFRRLAVFPGGCTLEGAEAVGNTRLDLDQDVHSVVTSLVEKSVLQKLSGTDGEVRFRMLQIVREYGLERLEEAGESEATKKALAALCLVISEEGNSLFQLCENADWLKRCDQEYENFDAAFDWLIEVENAEWELRLAVALYQYWADRELFLQARQWLSAGLELPRAGVSERVRAMALRFCAAVLVHIGDYSRAEANSRRALDLYRRMGDEKGVACELTSLGHHTYLQGRLVDSMRFREQAVEACRKLGETRELAGALSNLSDAVRELGDFERVQELLYEALAIFRALEDESSKAWTYNHLGDLARKREDARAARELYAKAEAGFRKVEYQWGVARSLTDLGDLACEEGELEAAREHLCKAVRIFLSLEHWVGIALSLERFSCLAAKSGLHPRALQLGGAAEGLRRRLFSPARPAEQAELNRRLAESWAAVEPSEASAAWESGAAMERAAAVAFALDEEAEE